MAMTMRKRQVVIYLDPLPIDLVIKIFSKLPLKTMAKCRCVSMLWSSIIRSPNYNQLFPLPIKSFPTPRLLFTITAHRKLYFYSSPQPQPQSMNKKSSLVANYLHYTLSSPYLDKVCSNVGGFICSQHIEKDHIWAVITNPFTGESLTTPKLTADETKSRRKFCFGYDPIGKQFKVYCMIWFPCGSRKYQVMTLGTGYLVWRDIQCCTPHYPYDVDGICINGVLYYIADIKGGAVVVVCFDVWSEKFSFIKFTPEREIKGGPSVLINYKGKLGAIDYDHCIEFTELWVLEDPEEHKWSKHSYKKLWRMQPYVVGTTDDFKLLLSLNYVNDCFSIYYHDLQRNKIRKVEVKVPGIKDSYLYRVYIFPNYVEDMKPEPCLMSN